MMRQARTTKRRLELRTETLRALSDEELHAAAGGGASLTRSVKCTGKDTEFCPADC